MRRREEKTMADKWKDGCVIVADNGHFFRDPLSMTDVPDMPEDKEGTLDRWTFLR